MSNITNTSPIVTEQKLTEFYEDIKPFLGCPAYITQEGDEMYFSVDEKVVGRWINNKPLYQKMIFIDDNDPTTSWTSKTINHNISNVEYINGYGYFQETYDSAKTTFALNTVSGGGDFFRITFKSDSVIIGRSSNWVMQGYMWIILNYTKTTDSAATTIEQKPTHYSTDEQVVGTWIDGKPLYQKTFVGTMVVNGGNIAQADSTGTFQFKEIKSTLCYNEVGTIQESTFFYAGDNYWTIWVESGYIKGKAVDPSYGGKLVNITLRYTKTTD